MVNRFIVLIVLLVLMVFFTVSVPVAYADDDVQVQVEVKEVEPGTERPEPETPVGEVDKGSIWKYEPKGPFDWISQHPLTLMFLQLPAESAYVLHPGQSRFGYRIDLANSFFVKQSGTGLVQIDLEGLRQTFSYRRGISDRIEVGAFIPLQSNTSGFMDGTIQSWHGAFGLPTGDRPNFAKNQFSYVVAVDNAFRINGESDQFGIGDITLTGKYFIRPEDNIYPALSARLGLKIPTGESGSQLGSGGFDFGFGLLAQKTYGRFVIYGQTDYVFTGNSDFDLDNHDLFKWSLAGEYQANRKHSWIMQLHKITNPFFTGVQDIDVDTVEMAIGWKRFIDRNVIWEGGFSEDVVVDSGPDFAIFSQLSYTF
jgi:hypothetical protein